MQDDGVTQVSGEGFDRNRTNIERDRAVPAAIQQLGFLHRDSCFARVSNVFGILGSAALIVTATRLRSARHRELLPHLPGENSWQSRAVMGG